MYESLELSDGGGVAELKPRFCGDVGCKLLSLPPSRSGMYGAGAFAEYRIESLGSPVVDGDAIPEYDR